MKQDPQNPASVPSVKRVQIQQLFIYDISQLDLEMLRQAALEPVTPPDTLDLTFSTFLLSVAASALFCIVGLAATGTAVKDWIYPVLGVVTLIAVIAGSYFALRYKKAVVLFETRRKGKEKEVERLLEEIKNRPLPQGQSHPRSDESGAWQQRVCQPEYPKMPSSVRCAGRSSARCGSRKPNANTRTARATTRRAKTRLN